MEKSIIPWLILMTAALSVVFLGGKRRAFGIFVAQLHAEYNQTSLAELNWIGDSYSALGYLSTSLTTSAILAMGRRFWVSQLVGAIFILIACLSSAYVPNPHWLFFSHTILHGIGSSLVLSTAGLVVNEHFDQNHRHHILATTLVSGGSVASILFVELYAHLIETRGWRQAFILLGLLYFVVIILGCFVFKKNSEKADYNKDVCSSFSLRGISFKRGTLLVLWSADRVVTSIVTYGMLLNLADYTYRHESSLQKSALLTTLFAAGEACTYLIGATITAITRDFLKNRLKYVLLVTSLGMSISLISWEFLTTNKGVSTFLAYFSGFFLGPSVTFLFPAGEELTLLPGHMAYPFSLGGMGVGMALSPVLSAVIAQTFKYRWFFLVQGFLMLIKFFCLVISTVILHYLAEEKKTEVSSFQTSCLDDIPSEEHFEKTLTSDTALSLDRRSNADEVDINRRSLLLCNRRKRDLSDKQVLIDQLQQPVSQARRNTNGSGNMEDCKA